MNIIKILHLCVFILKKFDKGLFRVFYVYSVDSLFVYLRKEIYYCYSNNTDKLYLVISRLKKLEMS